MNLGLNWRVFTTIGIVSFILAFNDVSGVGMFSRLVGRIMVEGSWLVLSTPYFLHLVVDTVGWLPA